MKNENLSPLIKSEGIDSSIVLEIGHFGEFPRGYQSSKSLFDSKRYHVSYDWYAKKNQPWIDALCLRHEVIRSKGFDPLLCDRDYSVLLWDDREDRCKLSGYFGLIFVDGCDSEILTGEVTAAFYDLVASNSTGLIRLEGTARALDFSTLFPESDGFTSIIVNSGDEVFLKVRREDQVKQFLHRDDLKMRDEPTALIAWENDRHFVFSNKEVWVGKRQIDEFSSSFPTSIHLDSPCDLKVVLDKFESPNSIQYLLAACDAFGGIPLNGVEAFKGKSALFIGDTHHGYRPIRNVIEKAKSEPFDHYITIYDRHHLHFLAEALGDEKVFWLPNYNLFPSFSISSSDRRNCVGFVGRITQFHPYRNKMIHHLMGSSIPFLFANSSIAHSEIHGQCSVAINLSLNGDFNLRNFGIIGHEAFMLCDNPSFQSGLELFFQRGRHYDTFQNPAEMLQKASFYIENRNHTRSLAIEASDVYWKQLNPVIIRKSLRSIFEEAYLDERFRAFSDPRLQYARSTDPSEFSDRIAIYECLQERHRRSELLSVTVFPDVTVNTITDLYDLPRIQLVRIVESGSNNDLDKQIIQLCQVEILQEQPIGGQYLATDVAVLMVSDAEKHHQQNIPIDSFSEILLIVNQDISPSLGSWLENQSFALVEQNGRLLYLKKKSFESKLKL